MNKAFVKEDDSRFDFAPEITLDARAGIPPGSKNYMTPAGARRLRNELEELSLRERPQLLQQINRSDANKSSQIDNEIWEAKKQLRRIDHRIAYLSERLELTEVVDPEQIRSDRIRFGATVTLQHESGEIKNYQIVGIDETDLDKGRISWTSPLAKAMLDYKAGDVLTFKTHAHEEEIEIVEVSYKEIL